MTLWGRYAVIPLAFALTLGGIPAAATASTTTVEPPSAGAEREASAVVEISGRLVVTYVDSAHHGLDSSSVAYDAHEAERRVDLVTELDSVVPLVAESVPDAETGATFTGSVEVPAEVLSAAGVDAAEVPQELIAADPAAESIVEAAQEIAEPLAVVDGETRVEAAAVATARPHTLHIAVVTPSGSPTNAYPDGEIEELKAATRYWVTESRGAIPSFTTASVQRYQSAYPCSRQPWDMWDEAASRFGYDPDRFLSTDAIHIALVLPESCYASAGLGLGSVGADLHDSGLLQLSTGSDLDTTTLLHELGHNLGLGHANLDFCDAVSRCQEYEYGDVWDLMGIGIRGYDSPTRTNVHNLLALGFIGSAQVPPVSLGGGQSRSRQRVEIAPIGATPTAQRPIGFQVADPAGGRVVLEYRTGESGVLYNQSGQLSLGSQRIALGRGVRMLRSGSDDASVAFAPSVGAGVYDPAAAAGESVTSSTGSVRIDVVSADSTRAVVDVTLTAPGAPPETTPPAPVPGGDGVTRWPLYKIVYDGTIYELVTNADGSATPVPLSYEKWRDVYRFAPFTSAPTDFVKYPWSPTIYAVTFWPGGEDRWQWTAISFSQWSTAGRPSPRVAGWIKGSYYYKWGTSSEIFVEGADGVNHALSYAEWQASGFRPHADRVNEGFLKLSWAGEIARMSDIRAGVGYRLSYAEWQEEAFPKPEVRARIPGDQFYRYPGSPTIWYAGPTMNRTVTFAEWQAAGSPAPRLVDNS